VHGREQMDSALDWGVRNGVVIADVADGDVIEFRDTLASPPVGAPLYSSFALPDFDRMRARAVEWAHISDPRSASAGGLDFLG
jgi:hypothetical protein